MTTDKKIELAVQDLAIAIEARATNQQMVLSERIEQLAGEASNRIEDERLHMQNEIRAAHRRIADLEKRIDDLENDGEDRIRSIVADMINDGDIRIHID